MGLTRGGASFDDSDRARPRTSPHSIIRGSGKFSDSDRARPRTSPYSCSLSALPRIREPLQKALQMETTAAAKSVPGFPQNRSSAPTFVHVKLRYTRWMEKARHNMAHRPGFVADERALIEDPSRKDAVMIRAGAPRAGQPLELHVHSAWRILQRRWRLHRRCLQTWASISIQCAWRQHCARQTLEDKRATHAKHNMLVKKITLMRCRTRMLL